MRATGLSFTLDSAGSVVFHDADVVCHPAIISFASAWPRHAQLVEYNKNLARSNKTRLKHSHKVDRFEAPARHNDRHWKTRCLFRFCKRLALNFPSTPLCLADMVVRTIFGVFD
jgi:hypothetical protein